MQSNNFNISPVGSTSPKRHSPSASPSTSEHNGHVFLSSPASSSSFLSATHAGLTSWSSPSSSSSSSSSTSPIGHISNGISKNTPGIQQQGVIIIYGNPVSQPSRAILWFCLENGIAFDFRTVDLSKGENRTEEFTKLNPNRSVPVLVDGDFVLYESAAILVYLAQKFGVADHWYPRDIRARALVDQYLHWHHTRLRKGAASLFFYAMIAPLFDASKDYSAEKKAALLDLETSLSILNEQLGKTAFLAGNTVSVADLQAATECTQHIVAGTYDFSKHQNVVRWLNALMQQQSYRQTHSSIAELFRALRRPS